MRALTTRAQKTIILDSLPKPIRMPINDVEKIILFLGGLFTAIGIFCVLMTTELTAGYVFGGLGIVMAVYALCSFIPYAASVSRNKDNLIEPIKAALKEEGYTLPTKKVLLMWSEGSGVTHGGRTFFASGRQATKFILMIM